MRLVLLLLLVAAPGLLRADPCAGIDTTLDDAAKAGVAPAIGRQLGVRGVVVKQTLRSAGWQVFLISARDADDSYVFYSGDPQSERFVDAIGAFALPEGEAAIRRWLTDNLSGIPAALAACVAQQAHKAAAG